MEKILYKTEKLKNDDITNPKLLSSIDDINIKVNFKNDRIKKFLEKILLIVELNNISISNKIVRFEILMDSVKDIELEIDKLILSQTNDKNIINKRLLVLENRVAFLEEIQAKILIDSRIEQYELKTLYEKISEYINYYYKIFDKYNDDQKNLSKVNISIFNYDFTNTETIFLKDYDSDSLKGLLVAFKDLNFILKLALQEKEVTAVITKQQKLINDNYKYKVSIEVDAKDSKNFFGRLTINVIGVKATVEKILDLDFGMAHNGYDKNGIMLFTFDNIGNWYAVTSNCELYFGTQTKIVKKFEDLKLGFSIPATIVIDKENNCYFSGYTNKDRWSLHFLKFGENNFKMIQKLRYKAKNVVIDSDNNWICADEMYLYAGKSGQIGKQYFDIVNYKKEDTFDLIEGLTIDKTNNNLYIWDEKIALSGKINQKWQVTSMFAKKEDGNFIPSIKFNKNGNSWYGIDKYKNAFHGVLGKETTTKFVFSQRFRSTAIENFTNNFNVNNKNEWFVLIGSKWLCYGKNGLEGNQIFPECWEKRWVFIEFDHNDNPYVISRNTIYAIKEIAEK